MREVAATAAVLMVLAASCSGSGGGGDGPTGINRNKPVSAATAAEKGAICDWFAPMTGGYGVTIDPLDCGGDIPTWPDRATCIATFPNCSATIGQYQDCLVDLVPLMNDCSQATLDHARLQPECQAAASCLMMVLAGAA
jgi:hypothetical protein